MPTRELSYLEAVREAQEQILTHMPEAYILGEDVGVYGGGFGATKGLIEKFPHRILETPISEAAISGVAMGSSMLGKRPIMEIQFSDFLTVAMDQIVNQMAKIHFTSNATVKLPVVIRAASGAGTGAGTQHSQSLEAWFAHVPGLIVAMPSNPYDAKGILIAAAENNNPVLVLEPKSLYKTKGVVPEDFYKVELGKSKRIRKGRDVTIIALGAMAELAKQAAEELTVYDIEIIDPVTISPLDKKGLYDSAKKTGRVLILTESYESFGPSAEIMASLLEQGFKGKMVRLGSRFCPIPASETLEEQVLPGLEQVKEKIEGLFHED